MRQTLTIPTDPTVTPLMLADIVQGDAIFTLQVVKSNDPKHLNERYTYRVRRVKFFDDLLAKEVEEYNVRVLIGPDNLTSYTYALSLDLHSYAVTKYGRKLGKGAPSIRLFCWYLARLQANADTSAVAVYLAGRCLRCGRPLTVPDSVNARYGPDCIGKVFGF